MGISMTHMVTWHHPSQCRECNRCWKAVVQPERQSDAPFSDASRDLVAPEMHEHVKLAIEVESEYTSNCHYYKGKKQSIDNKPNKKSEPPPLKNVDHLKNML